MTLTRGTVLLALLLGSSVSCAAPDMPPAAADAAICGRNADSLVVPDEFCVVDVGTVAGVGSVRHLIVAPNGDILVAALGWDGRPGGIVLLRDTLGDGTADVQAPLFEDNVNSLALRDTLLFYSTNARVAHRTYRPGDHELRGFGTTVVGGLPADGEHRTKSFVHDRDGNLYVSIGSATNACQVDNRALNAPGTDPCPELADHAGIWRFPAGGSDTTLAGGTRYATGLRNAVAMAWDAASSRLLALQHGIDDFDRIAPDVYSPEVGAGKPVEELQVVEPGSDFGWPYCYYEPAQGARVLTPMYGGNGVDRGRCEGKTPPVMTFPAHWGPNAALIHSGNGLPPRYRGGLFIAFHGPTARSPLMSDGLKVVFVPLADGAPSGPFEIFADGFAQTAIPAEPRFRPMGLAEGNDGSIYVSDNAMGRIWRIMPRR